MMPTTPASFSALLVSMLLILACGYLLRSVLMKTMPGMVMFSVYLPAPVTIPIPCVRACFVPITVKSVTARDGFDRAVSGFAPNRANSGAVSSGTSAEISWNNGSCLSSFHCSCVSPAA